MPLNKDGWSFKAMNGSFQRWDQLKCCCRRSLQPAAGEGWAGGLGRGGAVNTADRSHPSPHSRSRPPVPPDVQQVKWAKIRKQEQEVWPWLQNKSTNASSKLVRREPDEQTNVLQRLWGEFKCLISMDFIQLPIYIEHSCVLKLVSKKMQIIL